MTTNFIKTVERWFKPDRLELGAKSATQSTMLGTAMADSENGYVAVQMDGEATFSDDNNDGYVYIPSGPSVKKGDQVLITLYGGVGKTPVVTNVVGWGDDVEQVATDAADLAGEASLAASTAEQVAQEAAEAIASTNEWFWHDNQGAHVSKADATNKHNLLANSGGIFLRDGENLLSQFTKSAVAFYDGTRGSSASDLNQHMRASFGKDTNGNGQIIFGNGIDDSSSSIILAGDGAHSGGRIDYRPETSSSARQLLINCPYGNTYLNNYYASSDSYPMNTGNASANIVTNNSYLVNNGTGVIISSDHSYRRTGSVTPITKAASVKLQTYKEGQTSSANDISDIAFTADTIHVNGTTSITGSTNFSVAPTRGTSYTILDTGNYSSLLQRGAAASRANSAASGIAATNDTEFTMGSIVSSDSTFFASSGQGIQCKKAGTVLVSASVSCSGLALNNNLSISIYQGSTKKFTAYGNGTSDPTTKLLTVSITPRTLSLESANSIIYLKAHTTSGISSGTNTGVGVGEAYFTVQYI